MGLSSRLISGSIAGWASIALAVLTQIGLVPLFLHHWSVAEYGVWIAVQGMFGFCTALSTGLKTFAEFEFLKSGSTNVNTISHLLWSTLPAVLIIATAELLVTWGITHTSVWYALLDLHPDRAHGGETDLAQRAAVVLLFQLATWTMLTTSIGLFQRAIVPFGYYARNAWWYFLGTLVTTVATIAGILAGYDIVATSAVIFFANLLFATAQFIQLGGIFRRHQITVIRPDLRAGAASAWRSLGTGARNVLDLIQAQGIRVLLAGAVGLKEMTTFSTTRTINNVGLQAIGTISNPILPELMNVLNQRDAQKLQGLLWVFWFFTVGLLTVGLTVLQLVAPIVFQFWTLGKIRFDPVILALLSAALLIYGLTQPLASIVRGNNLQRIQLLASVIGASLTVALIVAFTGHDVLRAAAGAICLAELSNHLLYRQAARNWLTERGMPWVGPTCASWTLVAALGLGSIAAIVVAGTSTSVAAIVIALQALTLVNLFRRLPPNLRNGLLVVLRRHRPVA